MADTIRELIFQNLMTQLAKITVANGYNLTMGTPLRAIKSIDPSLIPVSDLFPGEEENEPLAGKDVMTCAVTVESYAGTGTTNSETPGTTPESKLQEKMLGDLRKNLTDPAAVWSSYIDRVVYASGGPIDYAEPGADVTAVRITLTIKYKTRIGNPYTQ